jgi:HD superfamily phosphohydrolase
VDKFDYFARDSYYLGTNISFEHMRFIKFYRVVQVDDGKRHLCLRDKVFHLFITKINEIFLAGSQSML